MAPVVRRTVLAFVASLAAVLPFAGAAVAEDRVGSRDVTLGNPQAPVTLVEYASVTCPHCARFNAEVFPTLRARYIATGQVQYVFREVPINAREDTAGFLIARCAGPDRYLAVTDALMRGQPILFQKHDFHGWLMAGAAAAGLSEDQMKACIVDVPAVEAFNARAEHTMSVDKIDSTPTLLVNGRPIKIAGPEVSFADVDAAIRPLLGATNTPARRLRRAPVH